MIQMYYFIRPDTIYTDYDKLIRILLNLLNNAYRFT